MEIEHVSIPHANAHEPKWITIATTPDSGKVITPSSSVSGTSELRRLTDEDFDYTQKSKNLYGLNDIADSLYTSGAPRAIASGVRTQLTNDALAAQTDTSRLGLIWNVAGSYFQVDDLSAFYVGRIQMKATAAAAAGTPYVVDVEVETSNGPTTILKNTHIIKGGGHVNGVSITTGLYLGSFINNTQLKVFITADTPINIYEVGFVIQRTYREK